MTSINVPGRVTPASGPRDLLARLVRVQRAELTVSTVVFVMRIALGWISMYHGAGKLFNFKQQGGISGTTLFFHMQGIPAAHLMAYVVGLTEFVGGLLLLVGLAVPFVGLALAIDMIVAMASTTFGTGMLPKVVPHTPIVADGFEINLALLALALALAALGAGALSLDGLLGLSRRRAPEPHGRDGTRLGI